MSKMKKLLTLALAAVLAFGTFAGASVTEVQAATATGADEAYLGYSGIPEYAEVREMVISKDLAWLLNYNPEANPEWQTSMQRTFFQADAHTDEWLARRIAEYSGYSAKAKEKYFYDKAFWGMYNLFRDMAEADTTNTIQYRVVFAAGTYKLKGALQIPNNTCVYAEGATFVPQSKTVQNLFLNSTVGKGRNIQIVGGTWDVTDQSYAEGSKVQTSSLAKLCGVTGVELIGVKFKSNRWSHIMEIADAKNVVFTGCVFTGNNKDSDEYNPLNEQPKEALQLDIATVSAMGSIAKGHANKKGCSYVTIDSCSFVNCGRALGSHAGKSKKFTEISVVNCSIKNTLGEGIFAQGWKNCTIANNTINKTKRAGMMIYYSQNVYVTGNTVKNVKAYKGKRAESFGSDHYSAMVWNSKTIYVKGNKFKAKQSGKTVQIGESKSVTAQK